MESENMMIKVNNLAKSNLLTIDDLLETSEVLKYIGSDSVQEENIKVLAGRYNNLIKRYSRLVQLPQSEEATPEDINKAEKRLSISIETAFWSYKGIRVWYESGKGVIVGLHGVRKSYAVDNHFEYLAEQLGTTKKDIIKRVGLRKRVDGYEFDIREDPNSRGELTHKAVKRVGRRELTERSKLAFLLVLYQLDKGQYKTPLDRNFDILEANNFGANVPCRLSDIHRNEILDGPEPEIIKQLIAYLFNSGTFI